MDLQVKEKTISLIDSLKSTCQTYGMGNDGNEYKIITQVFLYKYLNDKFGYENKNSINVLLRLKNGRLPIPSYRKMTERICSIQ